MCELNVRWKFVCSQSKRFEIKFTCFTYFRNEKQILNNLGISDLKACFQRWALITWFVIF